jgi:hypothetical protein
MKPTHDHLHIEDRLGENSAVGYLEDNAYRRNTLKRSDWQEPEPDWQPAPFDENDQPNQAKDCPWCHQGHPGNFDTNQCPERLQRLRNLKPRINPMRGFEPAPMTAFGEVNPDLQSPHEPGLHLVEDQKHPAFKNPHGQYTVNIGTYKPEYIRDWMLHHYPQQPMQVQQGYGGWDGKPEQSSALNLYGTDPKNAQQIIDHFGYAHPHEEAFAVIPHGEESQIYDNPHHQPVPDQGAWDFGQADQLPMWGDTEPLWEPQRQASVHQGGLFDAFNALSPEDQQTVTEYHNQTRTRLSTPEDMAQLIQDALGGGGRGPTTPEQLRARQDDDAYDRMNTEFQTRDQVTLQQAQAALAALPPSVQQQAIKFLTNHGVDANDPRLDPRVIMWAVNSARNYW